MAPLYQRCASVSLYEETGGLLLGFFVFDGCACKEFGFRDIGSDERCKREELQGERLLCPRIDKAGTARCHHNGVDNDVLRLPALQTLGDLLDDRRRRDHADLYRCGPDILKYHVDLVGHDGGVDVLDTAHAAGVLSGNRRDGAFGKQAVCGDGLDVCLDACPSARIGACNGQDGRQCRCAHVNASQCESGPTAPGEERYGPDRNRKKEERLLVIHAEVDRCSLKHFVDGAHGAHLAAHGAGSFGCGGRALVALAGTFGIKGVLPHLFPVELAARLAHAVVFIASMGDLLGDVCCMRRDLGGNQAVAYVLRIGQAQMLGGGDVAQGNLRPRSR